MAAINELVEVNRASPGETRVVESELTPLTDGQVRLRIDRTAITANNITYAVIGDLLGYWDFLPTGCPEWGRVPAMGWADIVESTHAEVAVGGRYYGWYQMARSLDLTVSPTRDGFRDDGDHRQAHASVYRSDVDSSRDPMYPTDAPRTRPNRATPRIDRPCSGGCFTPAFSPMSTSPTSTTSVPTPSSCCRHRRRRPSVSPNGHPSAGWRQ